MNLSYGYIEGGKITAPVAMRSAFRDIGAWHTLTDEERSVHGWYPCEVIGEGCDPRLQIRSDLPNLEFDGEKIIATYAITEKGIEEIRGEQASRLGEIRYAKETDLCSREDRFLLKDKIDFLKTSGLPDAPWKWKGEWKRCTVADLEELWMAIGLHIDKCYRAESEVFNIVSETGSREEAADLDMNALFEEAFAAID